MNTLDIAGRSAGVTGGSPGIVLVDNTSVAGRAAH
jgi:hypothetical protein